MNESDSDLRARFHQLRDDDRAHMPSFHELLNRARRASQARRPVWPARALWIVAAACTVLIAGVVLRRFGHERVARPVTAPATISTWKSPTAGLLRTSGHELLAPPSMLWSTLDGLMIAPVHRKGD